MATMTANNQQKITATFNKFAKRLETEYGIKVDFSNIKNDGHTLSFSTLVGFVANGTLETAETTNAKRMMPTIGFKPEIIGQSFSTARGVIVVTGYRYGAKRNVVQISVNGKPGYHCAPQFIMQVCASDPKFTQYQIKDFDATRLPQKRRRHSVPPFYTF